MTEAIETQLDTTVTVTPIDKSSMRNLIFKTENKNLDTVIISVGNSYQEVIIPATLWTIYWGGLKFMYMNCDRKVTYPELCNGVEELMLAEAGEKWNTFKRKSNIITFKNGKTVQQASKTWQERLVTNIRNLCRVGDANSCEHRLMKNGHVLRHETDVDGNRFFILYTTLNEHTSKKFKRGRKKRVATEQENMS